MREQRRRLRLLEGHRRLVNVASMLFGVGLGWSIGVAVTTEPLASAAQPGGAWLILAKTTAMAGSYLVLVMVLLMARIPALERAVGQDRLTQWHRRIGGWPVGLLGLHAVFVTVGMASADRTGAATQFGRFLREGLGVSLATVGLGLLVVVGVAGFRSVRRRMSYEAWWIAHLTVYLALALAFPHELLGTSFAGHPATKIVWSAMWAATAGTVLVARVGVPALRTARHRLRVADVRSEAPGVISLRCTGHQLERLRAAGGQYFHWRFLQRGLWWQAHPYSLSASPRTGELRVTIKVVGDHSAAVASLAPGTRIAIEGPYGCFRADRRRTDRALLVGAGVGITPIRAVLEELPPWVDVVVVMRAASVDQLVLRDEVDRLVRARHGHLVELVGPRPEMQLGTWRVPSPRQTELDARLLRQLVPDIAERDVYVCGPEAFATAIDGAAHRCGVPEAQVHREAFSS